MYFMIKLGEYVNKLYDRMSSRYDTLLTALQYRIAIPTLYAILAVRWGPLGSAKTW